MSTVDKIRELDARIQGAIDLLTGIINNPAVSVSIQAEAARVLVKYGAGGVA